MQSGDLPLRDSQFAALTNREVELLRLLTAYTRPADIARELAISKETVRTHLKNIRRKLSGRSPLAVARALAEAEGRPPFAVTPDRVIGVADGLADPGHRRVSTGLSDRLPVRRRESPGNDLSIHKRLFWIIMLAAILAIAFGMLTTGVHVISELVGFALERGKR